MASLNKKWTLVCKYVLWIRDAILVVLGDTHGLEMGIERYADIKFLFDWEGNAVEN